MSVTLSQLLTELPEKTRNSTTGALDNSKRTRAINRILQDLQDYGDWEFTKRSKTFYLIDGVTEYSLENYVGCTCQDNNGSTSILDLKTPYDLHSVDDAGKPLTYQEVKGVRESVRCNRSLKEYGIDGGLLVVNYPKQIWAQLHNCDSLTANGTVAASGDATNLTVDTVETKDGNGSLNFDVSAGTSLVITFTGISAKDLTTLQNKSHLLLKAYLPTITNFSSIKLEWGNDATNNWSKTETVPAGNQTLATGWNTFAFRWANATEVDGGSLDVADVDFLRVTITYSLATTDTDFRIDDVRIGKEVEMELSYYSQAMVKDSAGDYQLEFNADSVTQTDELLGGATARRCVVQGATYECFEMIGGRTERDRTDSLKIYDRTKVDLLKRAGHRLKRPSKQLNFRR